MHTLLSVSRSLVLAAITSATALSFAGCASDSAARGEHVNVDPTVLRGTWRVASLTNGPVVPTTNPPISITFEDEELSGAGKLFGFAGVNRFFGAYEAAPGGTIEIGAVGSTRMAGAPDLMNFEDTFLKWLGSASRYSVESGKVTLLTRFGTMELVAGE